MTACRLSKDNDWTKSAVVMDILNTEHETNVVYHDCSAFYVYWFLLIVLTYSLATNNPIKL